MMPRMTTDFIVTKTKEKNNESSLGSWSHEFNDHSTTEEYNPLQDYVDNNQDVFVEDYFNRLGSLTKRRLNQAKAMIDILKAAGWYKDSIDGYDDVFEPDSCDSPYFPNKSITEWSNLLAQKRKQIINDRMKNMPSTMTNNSTNQGFQRSNNEVKVISFLIKFAEVPSVDRQRMETISTRFTLNDEQERAFNIVAQHAAILNPEQLKMYLGGMEGTGKSQVIKALIQYFCDRKESHRFIVLAPTGSAAALVDGSTYHSVLAVNDMEASTLKAQDQMKERILGVQYIFVDEVSMISCHDMYVISKQLAIATDTKDIPFGGMNMIFAGDFAQLPPVCAASLYDGSVGTQIHSGMKPYSQECALGKAMWHQITTVVILRQNMRQKTQTENDAKFRNALENMRYRDCTNDDIAFLKTFIAGNERPLSQRRFAHVPIIVKYNIHRDTIYQEGARNFARTHKKKLVTFYSIDKIAPTENPKDGKKRRGRKPQNQARRVNPVLQDVLWDLSPIHTSHLASKLELCIGMPIIIKKNVATECCVTNGAQAVVYGWDSSKLPDGKDTLDVLFVKLVDPPRSIQLEGLPENVVPISKQVNTIKCSLPDDSEIYILRQQVFVLHNFAMTDYGSQGRTRKNNVCELHNCSTHQSMYTCLSRSSSADDTIILQGFDSSIVQGGLTGYLRQEFRELEILNEITKLRYNGDLPSHVNGLTRNTIIRQFFSRKLLTKPVPEIPKPIAWSESHPLTLPPPVIDAPWGIIGKKFNKDKNPKNEISAFHDVSILPVENNNNIAREMLNTQKTLVDSSDLPMTSTISTPLSTQTTLIDFEHTYI